MNSNIQPLSCEKILELFNLNCESVKSIDFSTVKSRLIVNITLVNALHQCPCCGNLTKKIKGYSTKKILHAALTHMPCSIHYRARRLVCDLCKKTFNEHNPFAYKNMKISALTVCNVLRELKEPAETFTSVANRFGISPSTVSALFDAHIVMPRRKFPRYLSMDECHAFRSAEDRSDYICVMIDAISGKTIDVLPSRKEDYTIKYFSQIPLEEREEVQIVGMDMWNGYRKITANFFPNAICSLDRFHVVQHFTRKMTNIRIRVMNNNKTDERWKQYAKNSPEYKLNLEKDKNYYLLKKFNYLLTKNSNSMTAIDPITGCRVKNSRNRDDVKRMKLLDPNVPKNKNRKLNRNLNPYDTLNLILEIDPDLNQAYSLKLQLETFYKSSTEITAKANLEQLIRRFKTSDIEEMVEFGNTLVNWKNEIIGSFKAIQKSLIVKDKKTGEITTKTVDSYITNALIENKNRIIKQVKDHGSGYANWERFRNRLMYVLNDDATFRLIPEQTSHRADNK